MKRDYKTRQVPTGFETDHLYLAAFLVCRGHPLLHTKTDHSGRIQFVFTDSPELRDAAADYLGSGHVHARQFSFEVLKLKKNLPRRK